MANNVQSGVIKIHIDIKFVPKMPFMYIDARKSAQIQTLQGWRAGGVRK